MLTQQIRQEAIPLVVFDQNTRCKIIIIKYNKEYTINQQAAANIRKIQGPIAVISVAGLYRTGKSYLLNRVILNRSDGFGVGPTVNPCTKGLWVWSVPLSVSSGVHNGQPLNLLIIDSEGTGSLADSDLTHDTTIFALSVLLSSTFVYNSVGAIDENAIEALGLVVNLTKFIQMRSGPSDDFDPQDYQQFMPQFYWVLRDFSLQLVDHNGDQLTPSQYLDRSLGEQPGFSDDVEQKNRIRRLLTAFFPERDCFTLVRPVLREEQLQQLDRLDLGQLRPEFYEQAMHFRSALMGRVKPKTIRGQTANGNMYINLLSSYLDAINNGGTPNIENSWTYVLREECQRALQGSIELYDKLIKENLQGRIPMQLEELKFQHKMAQEQSIAFLLSKAVGDEKSKFITEVKSKLKTKFVSLQALNEKESAAACQAFLVREFGPIDRKLKTQEYKSYPEYERDVRLFGQFLLEHGPKVSGSERAFLEFMVRVQQEGAGVFTRSLIQELEINKSVHQEFTRKSEKELKDLKEEIDRDRQVAQNKLQNLEKQKSECIKQLQQFNEVSIQEKKNYQLIGELKQQMTSKETELLKKCEKERMEFQQLEQELRKKLNEFESYVRQQERDTLVKESEQGKTLALLEQRVAHQQRVLDDYTKKEREFDQTIQSSRSEHSTQLREVQQKNEVAFRQLSTQLNDSTESRNELQEQLNTAIVSLNQLQDRSTAKEQQMTNQVTQLTQQIQKLSNSNQTIQKDHFTALQEIQLLKAEEQESKNADILMLRDSNRSLEEKIRELQVQYQREKAVLEQQIHFVQVELDEKRSHVQEVRRAHESALSALELQSVQSSSHQHVQKQFVELKEQHLSEIRAQDQEHLSQRRKLLAQIDQISRELNESQLQVVVLQSDREKALNEVEGLLAAADEDKSRLQGQVRELEVAKARQVRDAEARLGQRVNGLQGENDELKQRLMQESSRQQELAEEQIIELRNFYEMEKDMLERRIAEERMKATQRYQSLLDENDIKHREDALQYEDDVECLREEINGYEIQVQALQQQMENELELRTKQIESLESMLYESREGIQQVKAQAGQQMEQQANVFHSDIQLLETRCAQFQNQMQTRERDNLALSQTVENAELQVKRVQQEVSEKNRSLEKEKAQLIERLEEQRKKYTDLWDEYLDRKINYEKCIALSSQQNEFFGNKVDELEKALDSANQRYEERLRVQKQEWAEELNSQLVKLSEEKSLLDTRFSALKKQARESENTVQRLRQDLEKENALAEQKLQNAIAHSNELEEENIILKKSSAQGVSTLRDQLTTLKKQMQIEVDALRGACHHSDLERSELQGNYDRDRVLWSGKVRFLEQQRDQAKEDHADAVKKFELTVQQLQKARQAERGESSQEITEMLTSIERKYQEQLQSQQQQNELKLYDSEEKIRILVKELKTAQDQQILEAHGKLGSQLHNEKKFHELLENEKRLYGEVECLKNERDVLMESNSEVVEQERQIWKSKIGDIEERLRDQEKKQQLKQLISQLIFFHEKERAKWNLEKDHLQQQKCELQDQLQRIEKKKELLLRENEKIKSQSKSVRKNGGTNQTFLGGGGGNVNCSFVGGQQKSSDKKALANLQNRTAFDHYSLMNNSQDVTKSLEDDLVTKENYAPSEEQVNQSIQVSGGFGGFKKYYQMMNSGQVSPDKQSQ